jgi:hypothetical protein
MNTEQESDIVTGNHNWTVPNELFDKLFVENHSNPYLKEAEETEWLQEEVALIYENRIFPVHMKLLNDKNVRIIDTGASLSSAGNSEGMKNLIVAGNSQITMGNGGKMTVKAIGDTSQHL